MFKGLFKKTQYARIEVIREQEREKEPSLLEIKPEIPMGLWVKCNYCGQPLYNQDRKQHEQTCQGTHSKIRLSAADRIHLLLDEGSFCQMDAQMESMNPLNFPDYEKKLKKMQTQVKTMEAVTTGQGTILNEPVMIGVMDSGFMMGSMGTVVGEKLTRMIEAATEKKLPVVILTASGGARMQEGIFSLMQMAKVSGALAKHHQAGLLSISVLTDPTTGGVTASFAMLGDIILAEPGALIGFAGPRVIEQTIRQKLPEGFQKSEFLLEHGFIDAIVPRLKLKSTLGLLLSMHKEEVFG